MADCSLNGVQSWGSSKGTSLDQSLSFDVSWNDMECPPPQKKIHSHSRSIQLIWAVTDIERSSFAHGLNYSPTCSGMAWQYMGFDCWGWECTTTLTHELCSWQVKTWRNHWNSGCILGAATFQFFIVTMSFLWSNSNCYDFVEWSFLFF